MKVLIVSTYLLWLLVGCKTVKKNRISLKDQDGTGAPAASSPKAASSKDLLQTVGKRLSKSAGN